MSDTITQRRRSTIAQLNDAVGKNSEFADFLKSSSTSSKSILSLADADAADDAGKSCTEAHRYNALMLHPRKLRLFRHLVLGARIVGLLTFDLVMVSSSSLVSWALIPHH